MLVREIMNNRVKAARTDQTIREVAAVMCLNEISGVPVVDERNEIVGVLSEKDILHHMFPDPQAFMEDRAVYDFEHMEKDYREVLNLRVGDLMTRLVATVDPEMPVLKAAATMWLRKIRRIPVTEGKQLVGIVSIGDVHKALFRENLFPESNS